MLFREGSLSWFCCCLNISSQLFLCLVLGWVLIRVGLLKPTDSRVLSVVCLYLVIPLHHRGRLSDRQHPGAAPGPGTLSGNGHRDPCAVLCLHGPAAPALHLTPVEQASVIYSNCGNLIIPLVTAILGPQWVVFSSMYQLVQQFPLWSHCRILLSGDRTISLKKIFLNVNILSVFAGVLLFALNISLPAVIEGTMDSMAAMVGPMSMIVAGMLMGDQDILAVLRIRSIWKVAFLRLIAAPLIVLCILKFSRLAALAPDGSPSC